MMRGIHLTLTLLITSFSIYAKDELSIGYWKSHLNINDSTNIPFLLITDKLEDNSIKYKIKNASEVIDLVKIYESKDTTICEFKDFNSRLLIVKKSDTKIEGYWKNLQKSDNYILPLKAEYMGNKLPSNPEGLTVVEGKWKTVFNYNSQTPYPALGVFNHQSNSNSIIGTFLTETGDYRFLSGSSTNNDFTLSCFDGTHAFLFTAQLKEDTLWGTFYSGKHWETKWYAVKDDNFKLESPDSLTYVKGDTKDISFSFLDMKGNEFVYPNPNLKDKVILIQIMGTWCPNCLDETKYYNQLQKKYAHKGLEVIAVCYETGATLEEQMCSVNRLIKNYNLDYTFLIGGNASKTLASEQFNFLNEIISFPTSIYINKKGEIVRIHTGFNGPGTGEVYEKYVSNTNQLIEKLLAE